MKTKTSLATTLVNASGPAVGLFILVAAFAAITTGFGVWDYPEDWANALKSAGH